MKALIAEDNPVFRLALERMLRAWGYDVASAENGSHALRILQGDDPPRLALLDWMMPLVDGVDICRHIRLENREPYIYILLLTAKSSADELVEGMDAGADDYLTKPVNSHELRVRLRAGRRILDLQEELVQARETLRRLAMRDPLTQLWNRIAMFQILSTELKRAEREHTELSLIMADLDHFKEVNDRLGHTAGDVVLCEAARRITQCVRPYDAVCRYGGEEFLLILPGCSLADASARAEQIRDAVSDTAFERPDGRVHMTCSLGVACTAGAADFDAGRLIREADEALYVAKDRGRNRVEVFAAEPVTLAT